MLSRVTQIPMTGLRGSSQAGCKSPRSAGPAWPQRAMSLEAQMPWRDTIRLMLLALLMAALATAALKTLVDQLS
jgi:hypothetical protein